MKKLVLIPVAALSFISSTALLPMGGNEVQMAANADDIEAAVQRAERELETAKAAAAPFGG